MDNHVLFPETRRLSLSRIVDSSANNQPTLQLMREILQLNQNEPYIGVLWGEKETDGRVELYFCFTSAFHAYEFKRSLSAGIGSVYSYPIIDMYDVAGKYSPYINSLLEHGASHVLRATTYADSSTPNPEKTHAAEWLLRRALLLKELLRTKPRLTKTAEQSLSSLLNKFFNSYTTRSLNDMIDACQQLDVGGYLDARNLSFLRLMKLDALNFYSDILIDEEISDIVRGRMSSEVHRVVLKSLSVIYAEKFEGVDLTNPVESGPLQVLLEGWRPIFTSVPHNPSVLEESELSFHTLGRGLLGIEEVAVTQKSGIELRSNDVTSIEPRELTDVSEITEEVPSPISWTSWISEVQPGTDWSKHASTLREEGLNWVIDSQVVDQYLMTLHEATDDVSESLINQSFAIFIESLRRQFSGDFISATQLLSLSEEFVLSPHYSSEDYKLYRLILEMLKKTTVNGAIHEGQWQVLDQLIEKCGVSVFSLPDLISVLELLIDWLPRYDPSILNFWSRYVVPFATDNALLTTAEISSLDILGGFIQQNYMPLARNREVEDHQEFQAVDGTIGIYSLDTNALDRVVKAINATYPRVEVKRNSDSVATSALEQMSKSVDVLFFASSKAKHAAFYCVQNSGVKIAYPDGKGSTAMVRAIDKYFIG